MYTCGECREEFGDLEIGPHVILMHPIQSRGLELWPDGGLVTIGDLEPEDFAP